MEQPLPSPTPAGLATAESGSDPGLSPHASLACLADALPFLLARDDERPSIWLSAAFGREVEEERRQLELVLGAHELAARYASRRSGLPEVQTYGTAASRLGREALSVAAAIRCLELRGSIRLPSWHDLLRGRVTALAALEPRVEEPIWFG